MDSARVLLDEGRRAFRPGQGLSGRAFWDLDAAPEAVVVRLCWRTSGRGTTDLQIVDEIRWPAPPARDQRSFRFTLPEQPFSFSGQLISLTWTVEVVAEPSDTAAHEDFVMAPAEREVRLGAVAKE
jgi:hypothetical protein